MSAKYILRFDDICPTMNWKNWEKIEQILDKYSLKPILAVVPDNIDKNLEIDAPNIFFWDRVRSWQEKGYTIAMHGYQHKYVNANSGIINISNKSEFAGLSFREQDMKIFEALEIFKKEKINIKLWVAPSHSFDRNTIKVLKKYYINLISDGLWKRPVFYLNINFIPQQLWLFEKKDSGTWTVCFHHNKWDSDKLLDFYQNINEYHEKIFDINYILKNYSFYRPSFLDILHSKKEWIWNHSVLFRKLKIRMFLSRIKKAFNL